MVTVPQKPTQLLVHIRMTPYMTNSFDNYWLHAPPSLFSTSQVALRTRRAVSRWLAARTPLHCRCLHPSNRHHIARSLAPGSPLTKRHETHSLECRWLKRRRWCRRCSSPNCVPQMNSSVQLKQHGYHFEECGKVFGKTSHLKAYLSWHPGLRPFVCNWWVRFMSSRLWDSCDPSCWLLNLWIHR